MCKTVIIIAYSLVVVCPVSAMVIYVDDDASPGGNGQSWATAYRFLQDALAAAQEGDSILVAQGVYKPDRSEANPEASRDREVSFELRSGITLKGGYAGLGAVDPNSWDVELYETVLSGDLAGDDAEVDQAHQLPDEPTRVENSRHVLIVAGKEPELASQTTDQFLLEGLVITGGRASADDVSSIEEENGGGLLVKGYSHLIIRDCHFISNAAYQGGGLAAIQEVTLEICSSRFSNNAASFVGGGVYCNGLTGINELLADMAVNMIDCEFYENWSGRNGGGLSSEFVTITLRGCKLIGNLCEISGGGIRSSYDYFDVCECLLERNVAGFAGGGDNKFG